MNRALRFVSGVVFLLALTLVFPSAAWAQFADGRVFLSPSLGVGPEGGGTAYGALGEIRIGDHLGIGAAFSTWSFEVKTTDYVTVVEKTSINDYGAFGVWHFLRDKKLDPFVGAGIFNEDVSFKITCDPPDEFCTGLGGKIEGGTTAAPVAGVRYFFSEHFSVHAVATPTLLVNGFVGITISF